MVKGVNREQVAALGSTILVVDEREPLLQLCPRGERARHVHLEHLPVASLHGRRVGPEHRMDAQLRLKVHDQVIAAERDHRRHGGGIARYVHHDDAAIARECSQRVVDGEAIRDAAAGALGDRDEQDANTGGAVSGDLFENDGRWKHFLRGQVDHVAPRRDRRTRRAQVPLADLDFTDSGAAVDELRGRRSTGPRKGDRFDDAPSRVDPHAQERHRQPWRQRELAMIVRLEVLAGD